VLDANSFHRVFDPNNVGYPDFAPLRNWLYDHPRTSLVIGGTHYRDEIAKLRKYFGKLVELKRARKLSEILDDVVDTEETRVKKAAQKNKCNDPHLIALLCASGCRIFASHDKRADPFIKMKCLYQSGQHRPSIYRDAKHASLLCNENIVALRNLK